MKEKAPGLSPNTGGPGGHFVVSVLVVRQARVDALNLCLEVGQPLTKFFDQVIDGVHARTPRTSIFRLRITIVLGADRSCFNPPKEVLLCAFMEEHPYDGLDFDEVSDPGRTTDLGSKLRYARIARGLTLRDAAEKSGLSIEALSSIERGERYPSLRTLEALSTALTLRVVVTADDTTILLE